MKATNTPFDCGDVSASLDRIKTVLDAPDGVFKECDSIPAAEALTFENGFYVNCAAVFIDIRGSSKLPDLHTRPVLAKIYKAYIAECVAVLNGDPNCREVFINGDCVSGILEARLQDELNTAFETAARLNSMTVILNWQLKRKGYTPIECGIGLAWGRALMVKAGFKGSGINDLVWMGDVVNEASNLCGRGRKNGNEPVQVSSIAYNNLSAKYQGMLKTAYDLDLGGFRYQGDVVNVGMKEWLEKEQNSESIRASLARLLATRPVAPANTLLGPVAPANTLLGSGLFGSIPQIPPPPSVPLSTLLSFGTPPPPPAIDVAEILRSLNSPQTGLNSLRTLLDFDKP